MLMLKDKFVQRTRQKFVGHKIGMNLQMNALVMIVILKDAFAYKVAREQTTRHMFVMRNALGGRAGQNGTK